MSTARKRKVIWYYFSVSRQIPNSCLHAVYYAMLFARNLCYKSLASTSPIELVRVKSTKQKSNELLLSTKTIEMVGPQLVNRK